jgi:protein SCO1/2
MRRSPWGPILAALALVIASILWLHQRQTPPTGGPFDLVEASSGQRVTDQAFRGKWMLISFGYTHCPDVCPTTLGTIANALGELGPASERIQPLFITVDPERDTLPVLADYVRSFNASIVGLSGTADQIAAAAKAYRIQYAKRPLGDDYFMDHTAIIHVVRPDGTFALSLLPTVSASVIAKQMRALLAGT